MPEYERDPRGRPPKYHTLEEKRAAARASARKRQGLTSNITVDKDLVEHLNRAADGLVPVLGFRPTISQTLRHLLTVKFKAPKS